MYLGPDAAVPFASAIAAIIGVLVLFWHRTVAAVKGAARWIGRLVKR
ncbi:MAG TPA: hypothetical protein VGP61_12580 [Gemmatimonadales bacterium]|jgi:hypothetical protein|nr:hypothetical protein [Gemmatimonadales bacterium]